MIKNTMPLNYRLCSVTDFLCLALKKWRFYRNTSFLVLLSLLLKQGFMLVLIQKFRVQITTDDKLKIQIPIAMDFKS